MLVFWREVERDSDDCGDDSGGSFWVVLMRVLECDV